MQSKTSCFNQTLIWKNITRFWPVWAAYLLIWLLDMPIALLSRRSAILYDPAAYSTAFIQQNVLNGIGFGVVLSAMVAVAMAMAMWNFLYHARSASAAACLPLSRTTQFNSIVLAGLLPLAAVHVLIFLLTALAEASLGVLHLPSLLTWLGATLLALLFFYGFATLCAMLTGHIIILPAVYVVLNFVAAGLLVLINGIADYFLYGLTGFSGEWMLWLSPAVKMMTRVTPDAVTAYDAAKAAWVTVGWSFGGWLVMGIYAVVGIVMLFGARALLKKRRMETAGDVVAVQVLKPVFRWCMGICAGLVFADMMLYVFDLAGETQRMVFASTVLWLVIGSFLGWFIAEMMIRRSFKVFRGGWRGFGGWALCCVVLLLALTATELDVFGIEKHIPKADKIDGVFVNCGGETAFLSESEGVSQAVAAHKAVIDRKPEIDQCSHKTFFTRTEQGAYQLIDFRIEYHLTDGSSVQRYYSLPHEYDAADDDASAVQALLNCPEAVRSRKNVPDEFTAETVSYGSLTAVMPAKECAAAAGYDDVESYVLEKLTGLTHAQAEALTGEMRDEQLRATLAEWRWTDDELYYRYASSDGDIYYDSAVGTEQFYSEKYGGYVEGPAIPEKNGEIDWDRIWMNYTLDLTRQEAWELYDTCLRPDVADNALGRVWILAGSDYANTAYAAGVSIDARWPSEGGSETPVSVTMSELFPATDSGLRYFSFTTTPTVDSSRTNAFFEARGLRLYTVAEARAAAGSAVG